MKKLFILVFILLSSLSLHAQCDFAINSTDMINGERRVMTKPVFVKRDNIRKTLTNVAYSSILKDYRLMIVTYHLGDFPIRVPRNSTTFILLDNKQLITLNPSLNFVSEYIYDERVVQSYGLVSIDRGATKLAVQYTLDESTIELLCNHLIIGVQILANNPNPLTDTLPVDMIDALEIRESIKCIYEEEK